MDARPNAMGHKLISDQLFALLFAETDGLLNASIVSSNN